VKRVLVIDDSDLVIGAIRNALDRDGISVDSIADISSIERDGPCDFRIGDFDLVLIDVRMPARFDDSVAVAIGQRDRASTPIVLLSSLPEDQLAARAREAGLAGYILKGLGIDGVANEVRAWLHGRKQRLDAAT
jgi:DNA-binding response OmpR family regulator